MGFASFSILYRAAFSNKDKSRGKLKGYMHVNLTILFAMNNVLPLTNSIDEKFFIGTNFVLSLMPSHEFFNFLYKEF